MNCNFEIFYDDGVEKIKFQTNDENPKIHFPDVHVKKIILTIHSEAEDIITLSEEYFDIHACNSFAETLVINVKGSAHITAFNFSDVCNDLILNVDRSMIVKDLLTCTHGKLFVRCGDIFIFKNTVGCIYSYGDAFIFATNGIFIGEPKIGIETENGYTYKRVVKSELFISSNGNITLSSKNEVIQIEFCHIISNKNIMIGAPVDNSNVNIVCSTLRSITGSVIYKSRGTLTLKRTDEKLYQVTQGYPYLGAVANHMQPQHRTYHTIIIKQEYPSSGPSVIEAMENVVFEGGNHINSASTIMCGKSFISKNYTEIPLVLGTMSKRPYNTFYIQRPDAASAAGCLASGSYDPEFVGTWYTSLYISFSDYYIPNTSVYSTTVKTGESVQLNMGEFVISGNISSQRVTVSGQASSFSRLSKKRDDTTITTSSTILTAEDGTTYVKLNEYISQNLTPLERVENGLIINKFHMDVTENQNEIPYIGGENSKIDPLINISISPYVQFVLSGVANKVFVNGMGSDTSLLNSLIQNTKEVFSKIKENRGIERELVLDKSIIYKESSDESGCINTVLAIPKCEKEWQCIEDTVCHEFINETDSQKYTNYRIIGDSSVKVKASGNISRNTEKYSEKEWWFDGEKKYRLEYDVSYPQQQFLSRGDVSIESERGNYSVVGGLTMGASIIETARNISKKPLQLNSTYSSEHYVSSGFSGSTCIEQKLSQTSLLKTETVSSKSIHTSAKECINLIGVNEIAGESIEYTSKQLNIKCGRSLNYSLLKFATYSHFSDVKGIATREEVIFTPSIIQTPRLIINSKEACLNADISADQIHDNTEDGIKFAREIGHKSTTQTSISKSKMSSSESGSYDYEEIMNVCRISVNKIIRNSKKGCILFEDTIFEKLQPVILSNYLKLNYVLKTYHTEYSHSSQSVPDAFIAIAALAISFYTMGLGAVMIGGGCVGNAVVTSLIINMSTNLLKTGDIAHSLESFCKKEYIRSLGVSIVSAGLLGDPSSVYSSFLNRLGDTFTRNIVNSSISKIISNDNSSFKNIVKNTLIQSISGEVAKSIGDNFKGLERRFAHFALGSTVGFANGGTLKSTLSGGVGVLASEMIADYFLENDFIVDPLKASQLSTLISASMCTLLKGDVNSTMRSSINAFENNRIMHLSSEGREIDDKDDYNDFIEDELRGYIFPEKKIKKMIYTFEKKKYTDSDFSETYFLSSDYDNLQEKWHTVDSPLENIKKTVDRSLYNFSNIPNKAWGDIAPHEYFGLAPVYTLKAINATDNFFGGYLQKSLNAFSMCTNKAGNIARDVTFYMSGSASLSQDIGYTTTFALDMFLPVKCLHLSKIKRVLYPSQLMNKSYKSHYITHINNVEKWSVKDISASSVINFNKGDKLFPFLDRRIVREHDAPLIIYGHGCEVDMAIKSERLIVPAPSFTRKFENSITQNSYQQILSKRVDPKREFPVSITSNINKKIEVVDIDVNHRMLAKYIQKLPNTISKKEVGLYSCSVGGKNFSQNLSNKLNVPVHAPTKFLNIDYLMGTFEVVDCWYSKGIPKININGSRGILKTFLPGNKASTAMCIVPVIPSVNMYYGPEKTVSKNDEIIPFVKDGSKSVWNKGCISNDIILTKDVLYYNKLKEKSIIYKSEKCPINILAHGGPNEISIEIINDIGNGVLNYTQDKEVEIDGETIIDAVDFANILKQSPKYIESNVKHINLFSCQCGEGGINSFAQILSDELQVPVSGFEGYAVIEDNTFGSATHQGGDNYTYDKKIITYYPRPRRELSEEYNIYDSFYKKSIFDE